MILIQSYCRCTFFQESTYPKSSKTRLTNAERELANIKLENGNLTRQGNNYMPSVGEKTDLKVVFYRFNQLSQGDIKYKPELKIDPYRELSVQYRN